VRIEACVRSCSRCSLLEAEVAELRSANEQLKADVEELHALCMLQQADIDRFRAAQRATMSPNEREHVAANVMQLAFAEVVKTFGPVANDAATATAAASDNSTTDDGPAAAPPSNGEEPERKKKRGKKTRDDHGRRLLDAAGLPIMEHVVDPPEVVAAKGVGYVKIGIEHSDRIAHRKASWVVLRVVMTKWAKLETKPTAIVRAELPTSVWPRSMADASAVAEIIMAKYDMSLPLHRQERASPRFGFWLPRSTQCGWLSQGHDYLYRIVDAMMADACTTAHCIAGDATSAPLRQLGECGSLHVFVFIADRDHVIFRPSADHTGDAIAGLLKGFRGFFLSDAASIYGALYALGVVAVFCWAHVRRYFWKARETEPARAHEALAILAKLFEVERETADVAMPQRTAERARRAAPILAIFDAWIEGVRAKVDPRTPLAAALTYYDNQREGLRRFLTDGRLRIDNNPCELQLRSLVLGRRNWTFFENTNGAKWWCVFRSLIASCALHGLEPGLYLEQVLRLAPHWPVPRMLELSPKRWAATLAALTPAERETIRRPWEDSPVASTTKATAA
jgi:transposase